MPYSWIILCMCPANERRCYNITSSLIGWAHTQNDPCLFEVLQFLPGLCNVCCLKILNSLAPGRSEYDSKNMIFNFDLLIGIFRSSYDNVLWWMSQDLTDAKSALVQATSHYLSQCWFSSLLPYVIVSSLSPYGIARPQWVNMGASQMYVKRTICNRWESGIQFSRLHCSFLFQSFVYYSVDFAIWSSSNVTMN